MCACQNATRNDAYLRTLSLKIKVLVEHGSKIEPGQQLSLTEESPRDSIRSINPIGSNSTAVKTNRNSLYSGI